jgi:hypothetical protein
MMYPAKKIRVPVLAETLTGSGVECGGEISNYLEADLGLFEWV